MQLKITAKRYYIFPWIIKRLKLSCIVKNLEQLKLYNIFHETVKSHTYSIKSSAYINPWTEVFSREEYWRGCHALLQGIFGTQGSNPGPLHLSSTGRRVLYHKDHLGSPHKHIATYPNYSKPNYLPPQINTYIHKITRTTMTYLHKISSVQLLSHVQLFATLWTTAHQASLSITNSWSLPKLMSIESVMPSNHHHQHQGLFKWVSSSHQVAKVLELQLQHQSFQRTPRTDLL